MLAHTGMLRASSKKTGRPADVAAVVNPSVDPLLPGGPELLEFTDAAVNHDRSALPEARTRLLEAVGPAGAVRAAAVAANFQMMNRLLDALGVRTSKGGMALAADLGVDVPAHLHPVAAARQ